MNEKIFNALTSALDIPVYKNRSDPQINAPATIYRIISQVPALVYDNGQYYQEKTVQVNILTNDGQYDGYARSVYDALSEIGGLWTDAVEIYENGFYEKVLRFNFLDKI